MNSPMCSLCEENLKNREGLSLFCSFPTAIIKLFKLDLIITRASLYRPFSRLKYYFVCIQICLSSLVLGNIFF